MFDAGGLMHARGWASLLWPRAWSFMPKKNTNPGRIPVLILRWMTNPEPDLDLGKKIMYDMSKYTDVLLF